MLKRNSRQRTRRRPRDHRTVGDGIHTAVTRTHDAVLFGSVKHGTRGVRTYAAESEIRIFRRTQQDARLNVSGITEDFRAADGNVTRSTDYNCRKRSGTPARENSSRACGRREGSNRQERVESAARDFPFAFVGDGPVLRKLRNIVPCKSIASVPRDRLHECAFAALEQYHRGQPFRRYGRPKQPAFDGCCCPSCAAEPRGPVRRARQNAFDRSGASPLVSKCSSIRLLEPFAPRPKKSIPRDSRRP